LREQLRISHRAWDKKYYLKKKNIRIKRKIKKNVTHIPALYWKQKNQKAFIRKNEKYMKTLLISHKVELGRSEQPNVTWAEPTKEELKRNTDSIARARYGAFPRDEFREIARYRAPFG
jgi:tRNA splicing ligase